VKVVLDTNVLLSAFTKPGGRVVALWEAAMERRYHLLISPAIVAEVAEKLRSKFGWGEARILQRSKLMAKTGKKIIVPRLVIEVMRDDPDDNRILECAVEGKADLIVSGDRALLRLKSYDGIPIVRPVDFLRILGLA
jgi:uncharacterized protein